MRRAPLALLAAALALAASALAWYSRRTPDRVLARLAGATRPLDARLSSPAADRYRPFAAGRTPPHALEDVALVEASGDRRALAEAELVAGQTDRALDLLTVDQSAHPAPELLVDRAAAELARGHAQAALALCDRALTQPLTRRGPAMWNRALALEALLLPMAAAQQLDGVAALHEPGWSDEAHARADKLRASEKQRDELQSRAVKLGLQMVADGHPLADDIVQAVPDVARLYLYDAVRAAPSADRVRELGPLAARLDGYFGGHVLSDLVARIAAADFKVRAPLADKYRAGATSGGFPPGAATDQLLAAARRAGRDADDIYLGVEYLAYRRDLDAAEYTTVARAQHDPWFDALAADTESRAASNRGDVTRAATLLKPAIDRCWAAHLEYRCLRLADALVTAQINLLRLEEAEQLALDSFRRASRRDNAAEGMFLRDLAEATRLSDDPSAMNAYLDEMLDRAPQVCDLQQYVHEMRAQSALLQFETDQARRELDAVPACPQEPRYSVVGLALLGYLQRLHGRPGDEKLMSESLALWRGDTRLAQGFRLELDVYEALAKLPHDEAAARAQLERTITAARQRPEDDNARRARSDASIALIMNDAGHDRWAEAHHRFADALDRAEPPRCSVGVLIDVETVVDAWRDARGNAGGRLATVHQADLPAAMLVPPEVLQKLSDCPEIGVLALPPLNGRPDLLPPTVAWSYGVPATTQPQATATPRRLVVTDVLPPAGLGLASLTPRATPVKPGEIVLRGAAATPQHVLAELPDADEAEFDVHGLVDLDAADASLLVLSPDSTGHYALTANDIRKLELARKPIIALAACSAAHTAPFMHTVWSLPAAFTDAGARAVLASATPIPDLETATFFANVLGRVRAGATPAIALRDERRLWLQRGQKWTDGIMLFQ